LSQGPKSSQILLSFLPPLSQLLPLETVGPNLAHQMLIFLELLVALFSHSLQMLVSLKLPVANPLALALQHKQVQSFRFLERAIKLHLKRVLPSSFRLCLLPKLDHHQEHEHYQPLIIPLSQPFLPQHASFTMAQSFLHLSLVPAIHFQPITLQALSAMPLFSAIPLYQHRSRQLVQR